MLINNLHLLILSKIFFYILHNFYNFTELLNHINAITKKYGNLTRLIYGTNVFVVVTKPDDYKVSCK